jgi:hypothetical protein
MPVGSVNNDHYGVDRPGANLFGNSLVAVDVKTGKLKWYFQAIHHDLWDYDMPAAPMLFDVVQGGKKIPAVAVITKNPLCRGHHQKSPSVHSQSRNRKTDLWCGRAPGAQRRRAGRVVLADPAVSSQASTLGSAQLHRK